MFSSRVWTTRSMILPCHSPSEISEGLTLGVTHANLVAEYLLDLHPAVVSFLYVMRAGPLAASTTDS